MGQLLAVIVILNSGRKGEEYDAGSVADRVVDQDL